MDLWRYAQHMFHSYGELILLRGEPDRAMQYADECLAIAEPANHRKNVVKGRRLRGEVFLATESLEKAETELTRALEIAEDVGNPPQLWKTWAALGELRKKQDRLDDSKTCYREALSVIERVAASLDADTEEDELRKTFLNSNHVRAIRTLAGL
ncbi:MAG: hypothetical protein E2P02_19075 [Acidobacteria bacterium]|nr:MAG: hypothetical protein E2P02_19075 [Acidobacteriota bacterium]